MPKISNSNTTTKSAVDLDLFVRSRTDTFFQGKAKTVTSVNQTGVFDILPMHANFITMVKDYVVLDKGTSTEKKVEFKSAVLSVIDGKIDIYVGI